MESLLNVGEGSQSDVTRRLLTKPLSQANPRLAIQKDEDERLPLHWACSYNYLPIVELLVSRKDFDPDVQDGSGWTPLMIASSLPEGDELVDLLLSKGADVNAKSRISVLLRDYATVANGWWMPDHSGQVSLRIISTLL